MTPKHLTFPTQLTAAAQPGRPLRPVQTGGALTSIVSGRRPAVISSWCHSPWRRFLEALAAAGALLLLAPLLVAIAALVRATSEGPAIFRQERVGCHGRRFTIWKFRTMYTGVAGPGRSAHRDARVTSSGRLLRRTKLDELPQLGNVLRGEMSFVGPRPKLPGHDRAHPLIRPGLTGAATLAFASEESLMRDVSPETLEDCHRLLVTPRKRELDLHYQVNASPSMDWILIWRTLCGKGRYRSLDELGGWSPRKPVVCTVSLPPTVHKSSSEGKTRGDLLIMPRLTQQPYAQLPRV